MPNEVMIDIETLSTSTRAVVLSVAAHTFNKSVGLRTTNEAMWTLNLDEQFAAGRSVSESTLMFWLAQKNTPAFDIAFAANRSWEVNPGLCALSAFIRHVAGDVFWANSPNFDMVILESLYRDFGIAVPWRYHQWRDVRTIAAEADLDRKWTPPDWDSEHEMPHHPLSDCRRQIAVVKEARRRLGITPNAS